jgi:hypothetical protein
MPTAYLPWVFIMKVNAYPFVALPLACALQPVLPSLASRTRVFESDEALYKYVKDPGYNREPGKKQVRLRAFKLQ